jgi:preprotein translocase subunit SecA
MEEETVRYLYLFEIRREDEDTREKEREESLRKAREKNLVYSAGDSGSPVAPTKREQAKVGRNDPCPCGSGKKFKKCHGA